MTEEVKKNHHPIRAFVITHTGAFKKLEKNLTGRGFFDKFVMRKDKNGDSYIGLVNTKAVQEEDRRKGIILIKADKQEDVEMLTTETLEIVQRVITLNHYIKD